MDKQVQLVKVAPLVSLVNKEALDHKGLLEYKDQMVLWAKRVPLDLQGTLGNKDLRVHKESPDLKDQPELLAHRGLLGVPGLLDRLVSRVIQDLLVQWVP